MQLSFRLCQRWRDGRDQYRPKGEPIRTAEYHVEELPGDLEARAFVLEHHYSRSYPAARRRYGLFHGSRLVGVAVFSVPCSPKVLEAVFDSADAVELGRFVLLDEVPANGETWFLAQVFPRLKKEGFAGVLAHSDPYARTAIDGSQVFPGHIGTIYQAHNAVYLGQAPPRHIRLLEDGSTMSARTIQKIRAGERGWKSAANILVTRGADVPPPDDAERRDWLRTWLPEVTRSVRHPGNHRYAWSLHRAVTLPPLAPETYPKELFA